MNKEIMIDIETLGLDPSTAPVISIGVVIFDLQSCNIDKEFYVNLDMKEQVSKGRTINLETVKWWLEQETEAKSVFKESSVPVAQALNELNSFLKTNVPDVNDRYVWGNGSYFDISFMESIYREYNVKLPWKYNRVMDLRTFTRFNPCESIDRGSGTHHNALDDARAQAQMVISHFKRG